ncbi:glycosyltransferase family 2 protein [Candidatus Collierbacteria bacterium]|nr:glycosyltransferase family 2 protein [Candidatus Collierbacteria bacterium]
MKIATVILVYGKSQNLEECLASLKVSNSSGIDNKIIVVDNSKDNAGYSGGNNKGILQALAGGAEAVLLLNDDTKVDKSVMVEMLEALKDKQVGMVSPKIYFYPGFEYHKDRYKPKDKGKVIWYAGGLIDWNNCLGIHRGVDEVDIGQYQKKEETEFATGCAVLVKKEVFEKIGLYDERYFLYLEDLDLSVRVKRAGFKIIYQPKAVVWHKNAQSSGSGSGLHDYFFTRNRLLFGLENASFKTKFALVRESIGIFLTGNNWKRRGVLDFYLRKLGRGSWI